MTTKIEKEPIKEAYLEIRDDKSDVSWAVFKYNGNTIVLDCKGSDYQEFKNKFSDDDRGFGFVRVTTGDEMSKRAKFALISWVGHNVNGMKRAKMGTDKSLVKNIVQSFAIELMVSDNDELDEAYVRGELARVGGANYGDGRRDI